MKTAELSSYCRDLSVSIQKSFLSPVLPCWPQLCLVAKIWQEAGALIRNHAPPPPTARVSPGGRKPWENNRPWCRLWVPPSVSSFLSCSVTGRSCPLIAWTGFLVSSFEAWAPGRGRWGSIDRKYRGQVTSRPQAAPFLTGPGPFPGQQGSSGSCSTRPFSSPSPESPRELH